MTLSPKSAESLIIILTISGAVNPYFWVKGTNFKPWPEGIEMEYWS